jgi:L-asparaginase II
METVQTMLLSHVQRHTAATNVVQRAGILGVSVPTYHKRLRALAKDSGETRETGE